MKPLSELLTDPGPARAIRTTMSSGDGSTEAATARSQARSGECDICGGARFVRVTADPGDPDFGRPAPCQCVSREDQRERRNRLQRFARLGSLTRFTFDTLLPEGRSANAPDRAAYAHAVEAAKRFADNPSGWLLINGVHGSGKTHIAAAIANRRIDLGEPVLFLSVADLLDHLRSGYQPESEMQYDGLLEQVRSVQLLVLDDLDSFQETAWAREKLFQVLSYRFNAELPTVFTSALSPGNIESRLATRLTDPSLSQVLDLGGEPMAQYFAIGAMTRDRLSSLTFDRFRPGGQGLRGEARRNLEGAFRLAHQWASAPDGWLVFLGRNGCGKTHLAAAIAEYRLAHGDSVGFANVPDLLDELRGSYSPDADEGYQQQFRRLTDVGLLVLDDLGAHQSSAWAEEKLYQLLNHRHLARAATVITTNLELKKMEPRIASRLADLQASTVYEITAPDFRTGGTV